MSSHESVEHILWQSDDGSICLIDGPASIKDAQGPRCEEYSLISTSPRCKPFASQEPKTEAARQRLLATAPINDSDSTYAILLDGALQQLTSAYNGPWCLSRTMKSDSETEELNAKTPINEPAVIAQDDWPFVSNASKSMTHVTCRNQASLFFPALSTFMLADCSDRALIASFHANIRAQANEAETTWRYDCMIMDPPWSNRSAKRKRGSYKTAEVSQVYEMLSAMDLDRLMSRDCLVAVWITNKASVRETVLGEEGLFQAWGVEFVEEWLWLKVTSEGEPISSMTALWRKPYEVLLLGRRRSLCSAHSDVALERKVLVSVPDLHSRKPCLKSLIEPMLPSESRVLEVFARHLVTGWWSWGDECTKYNQVEQWQKR